MRAPCRSVLPALSLALTFALLVPAVAHGDEVLAWNAIAVRSMVAGGVGGPLQPRTLAIVHAAVFDAVNGIERRYHPVHVDATAPPGASRRAAAVQAAYSSLVAMFPAQSAALAADLDTSLAAIAADAALENSQSIARGRAWGAQVAAAIVAWRATDGATAPAPPFTGDPSTPGKWRPTPTAFANGAFVSLATSVPWVIPTASSFRSPGPPSLTSLEYAADVNEVKRVGSLTAPETDRSAEQTISARFWAGAAASVWNRAAVSAAQERHLTLSENARLLVLLNMAAADAAVSCWDGKYLFNFWRPITAIRLADTDGNGLTEQDATWTPLVATPPYPEYDSGHQSISGASYAVLTAYFGAMRMEGFSEGLPGVVRTWPSFEAAADDAFMARIWAGIHFRSAMRDTRIRAEQIAAYVLEHAAQPVHGRRIGQISR